MIKVSSVNNSLLLTFKKPNMWQWMMAFYVLYTFMAILGQFMNYASVFIFIFILFCAVKNRGRIVKRPVAFVWCLWILLYPILDNFLRGEYKLQLYELLSYGTVILFLIFADDDVNNVKGLLTGFKIIAWFNVFGILLQNLIPRLHTIIAWRLLGTWLYNITAFTSDATMAAFIFAVGIGIAFAEMISSDRRNSKLIKILEIIVLSATLIMTTKRSLLVATVAMILIEWLIISSNSFQKFFKTLLLEFLILIVLLVIFLFSYFILDSENAFGRLGETIVGYFNGEDVSNMRSVWAELMNEWRQDNVWFGIGWESFRNRIIIAGHKGVPNGHNVYMQIMCEEGYFGLIVFIVLLLYSLVVSFKCGRFYLENGNYVEKKLTYSALSIFIIFVIYMATGNGIYDSSIYLFFFAAILILALLNYNRRKHVR